MACGQTYRHIKQGGYHHATRPATINDTNNAWKLIKHRWCWRQCIFPVRCTARRALQTQMTTLITAVFNTLCFEIEKNSPEKHKMFNINIGRTRLQQRRRNASSPRIYVCVSRVVWHIFGIWDHRPFALSTPTSKKTACRAYGVRNWTKQKHVALATIVQRHHCCYAWLLVLRGSYYIPVAFQGATGPIFYTREHIPGTTYTTSTCQRWKRVCKSMTTTRQWLLHWMTKTRDAFRFWVIVSVL